MAGVQRCLKRRDAAEQLADSLLLTRGADPAAADFLRNPYRAYQRLRMQDAPLVLLPPACVLPGSRRSCAAAGTLTIRGYDLVLQTIVTQPGTPRTNGCGHHGVAGACAHLATEHAPERRRVRKFICRSPAPCAQRFRRLSSIPIVTLVSVALLRITAGAWRQFKR